MTPPQDANPEPTTPRRGRPRIYRDRSQEIEGARLRKQRQRERERDSGLVALELRIPAELVNTLTKSAFIAFTDPKALASRIVSEAIPSISAKIEALEIRAGELWTKAQPYLRHGAFLKRPGAKYRPADQTLTHAEWAAVTRELADFRAELTREGWPLHRIDRFLRRSAERRFLRLKHQSPR